MNQYDLTFSICEVPPEVEARVAEVLDVTFARHSGICELMVTAEGQTAVTTAKDVIKRLTDDFGITVYSYYDELGSRADMADPPRPK